MEKVNPTIYREYDIRGIADSDFSEGFALLLGRAIGTILSEKKETVIAVGRDCRLTSEKYTKALIKGLLSCGVDVVNLGICPTPLVYFAIFHEDFRNGISVTGSHNPKEFNGFKITIQKKSFFGKDIQNLRTRIEKNIFLEASPKGNISLFNITQVYEKFVTKNITLGRPLKVVVDAGNGTAGPIAPSIFRKLGCSVTELFCDMDGSFPNHFPDPAEINNLKSLINTIKEKEADVGIAFDGDADRIGVVDNSGRILWGDELLILYAKDILQKSPGATIMGEVKCSKTLFSMIQKFGGRPIMWKTGHSLIKSKLVEEKALLAGEMSGHMFFADRYFGFDDAIYAACRLLEIMSHSPISLSQALSFIPKTFSTPEIRLDCSDEKKFEVVQKAKKYFEKHFRVIDIDGVRVEFDNGWALVRASNTQPALVLRFEASSAPQLEKIRNLVETKLKVL